MPENNLNEEKIKEFVQKSEVPANDVVGAPLTPTTGAKLPWQKTAELHDVQNEIGWEKLKLTDLPTQGLFYPEGTEITIRSATGGEIRHWSTLNEEDLSSLDDMLNWVLEKCCNVKYPNNRLSSWRDIKEVDRFYIILAIRERTFVKGENQLQVKVSESNRIDVVKDMISYITFDDQLMQYYSPEERCIVFTQKNGKKLRVYLPSAGVTNWLKQYIIRKRQMQEPIDEDFVNFAPFVIGDWRGLNDATYEKAVMESNSWSDLEVSLLTETRKIFSDTIDPVIKYRDEKGGERVIPLNFQGGIKSLFLVSNPFSKLA
jgi:hypothetical protein